MEPYKMVQIARHPKRPSALYYIHEIFNGFIEFHGDRYFKDDGAVVGGIAMFKNMPVTVIGIQKGMDTKENIERNFGQPNPEGYRKALRLMKQAEKFHRPIVLFVNTSGAYCGIGAEERGQGEAIAKNLFEMFQIKVPILSFITGEGGSGGALALAVADKVYALSNSIYSILSPEGFATILWKDDKRAKEAAKIMKLTSDDLLELKIIDGIIEEAKDGAHNDPQIGATAIRYAIESDLSYYKTLSMEDMLEKRYNRFRKY